LLAALLTIALGPVFSAKPLVIVSLGVYVLAAEGLLLVPTAPARIATGIAIAALMFVSNFAVDHNPSRADWRAVVARIERDAAPSDLVLFHIGTVRDGVYAYYRGRADHATAEFPIGARIKWTTADVAAEQAKQGSAGLERVVRDRRRIWLVRSYVSEDTARELDAWLAPRYGTETRWSSGHVEVIVLTLRREAAYSAAAATRDGVTRVLTPTKVNSATAIMPAAR
jgi:hypothetical protein